MDRFLFAKNPLNLNRPAERTGYVIDTVWGIFYEIKRFPGDVYTVTVAKDFTEMLSEGDPYNFITDEESSNLQYEKAGTLPKAAIRWLKSYLKHEGHAFTKIIFES
jgi:hypothetical protein